MAPHWLVMLTLAVTSTALIAGLAMSVNADIDAESLDTPEFADELFEDASFTQKLPGSPLPGSFYNISFLKQHPHVRCATREPTSAEAKATSDEMTALLLKKGIDPTIATTQPFDRVVEVYWHIIVNSAGTTGGVSNTQVRQSVARLNKAFSKLGLVFALESITRSKNNAWFSAEYNSAAELSFKTSLRVGGADALNIYSNIPMDDDGNQLLGYATFPSWYRDEPVLDGVVVHYNTVPGGGMTGFNEGDTLIHEV